MNKSFMSEHIGDDGPWFSDQYIKVGWYSKLYKEFRESYLAVCQEEDCIYHVYQDKDYQVDIDQPGKG